MIIPVIAIIGAGNMGRSLIGGLINCHHPADALWAADTDVEKLTQIEQIFHVHTTPAITEAVQHADVVILAIKPQVFATVIPTLAAGVSARKPLVISIAAGISTASIEHWLGSKAAIVRTMPNTAALINCGATALFANPYVTPEQRSLAESILRAVGIVVWVADEKLIDTVTALSGSGPAYFFLVMEALQTAAEELGLAQETATLLTLQTAIGAVRMASESGKTLTELRQNVTSAGGTTEKAIAVLEENNIRGLFKTALQAAKLRSEELAEIIAPKGDKH